jgi:hypothetical protein
MARGAVLAGVLAGALGLGAGLVLAGRGSSNAEGQREPAVGPPPAAMQLPAHPNDRASQREGHAEPGDGAASQPGAAEPREDDAPGAAGVAREAQLASELERLKKREAEARQELEASQRALEARDRLEKRFAPREFDLSPEDWRQLARRGTLKLRIPCAISPGDDLSRQQLERLGLVPEDAPIITAAFQHSAERVWAAIAPLCARVLGTTPERAAARGPNLCRRAILRDASQNGTALPAFQRAAAHLAGDAPAPTEPSPVESLVLALAREQDRLEQELAEYLGPEEADRLVFSEELCFTEAIHQLGEQQAATQRGAGSERP